MIRDRAAILNFHRKLEISVNGLKKATKRKISNNRLVARDDKLDINH